MILVTALLLAVLAVQESEVGGYIDQGCKNNCMNQNHGEAECNNLCARGTSSSGNGGLLETQVAALGDPTTDTIICSDANVNNEGCFECYKNKRKACKAKRMGKAEMVLGYCSGEDAEWWNYKCVEATTPCECARQRRISFMASCTDMEGVFLDKGGRATVCLVDDTAACANVDVVGSRGYRISTGPCPQKAADDEVALGWKFPDPAGPDDVIPCATANINMEGCWECYSNDGARCSAKVFLKPETVEGVCSAKGPDVMTYKCVAKSAGEEIEVETALADGSGCVWKSGMPRHACPVGTACPSKYAGRCRFPGNIAGVMDVCAYNIDDCQQLRGYEYIQGESEAKSLGGALAMAQPEQPSKGYVLNGFACVGAAAVVYGAFKHYFGSKTGDHTNSYV